MVFVILHFRILFLGKMAKCFDLIKNLIISMPKDYKKTAKDLQQYLADEKISDILGSPNVMIANQKIITYLLEAYGQQLSSFLSILESVKDAPALNAVIKRYKESKFYAISLFSSLGWLSYYMVLYFLAYSLAISAECQLPHLMGFNIPSPTSSVGPTCQHSDDPMVFTILEANKVKPECKHFEFSQNALHICCIFVVVAVLRKYYDLLLSSFPQDPHVTEERLHVHSRLAPPSCPDSQLSNQLILDRYITMLTLSSEQCTPSLFCKMMTIIIGNTDITTKLENGMKV